MQSREFPVDAKTIAVRCKLKLPTVKKALQRLAHGGMVINNGQGYELSTRKTDDEIAKMLKYAGDEASLPRIHDIHLICKPGNIPKLMGQHKNFNKFFKPVNNRGPDANSDDNIDIQGVKSIAPLLSTPLITIDNTHLASENPRITENQSGPLLFSPIDNSVRTHKRLINNNAGLINLPDGHLLKKLLNPIDPESIYQKWDRSKVKDIKGGYQEKLRWKKDVIITAQIYGTGVININIQNSTNPFDARGFTECLGAIDIWFQSKCGVDFSDISDLFTVEQVHFNNDIENDKQASGLSKLNITTQQFEGFLVRTYEKTYGGKDFVRQEVCMNTNTDPFESKTMGVLASLLTGNQSPQAITAQAIVQTRNIGELVKGMDNTNKVLLDLVRSQSEMQKNINSLAKGLETVTQAVTVLLEERKERIMPKAQYTPDGKPPSNEKPKPSKKPDSEFQSGLERYVNQSEKQCPKCRSFLFFHDGEFYCEQCDEHYEVILKKNESP